MDTQLLIAIFTVIGAIGGYYIKDFLDKKRELNSENNRVKREMYKNFISLMINVLKNAQNKPVGTIIDIKKELNEFYKDYCLYSSPKVINAFGDFMQYSYSNPTKLNTKTTMEKLGEVIKTMRDEVGLSNRKLGLHGEKVFRSMFKDFDQIMKGGEKNE